MKFTTKGYERLTIEAIYNNLSDYDMFKYYISSFDRPGKTFCSELRRDRSPSCSIKITETGRAVYKDFSTGEVFNPIQYIIEKYGFTYKQALITISNDFNLNLFTGKVPTKKTMNKDGVKHVQQPKVSEATIRICSIVFTHTALMYWSKYGINKEMLDLFEVKQIQAYYLNDSYYPIKKNRLAFAYRLGPFKYKILQLDSSFKWMTNCNASKVQGYNQLPERGNTLFITKSLKDVMTLRGIGLYSIAPQSESTELPHKAIKYFKERWKRVIIYYDNDAAGLELAEKHANIYNVPYIHNPIGESKDASDYYKDHSEDKLKILIKSLLDEQSNLYQRKYSVIEKQQNKDQQGDIPF
jgi:hypothetical protein